MRKKEDHSYLPGPSAPQGSDLYLSNDIHLYRVNVFRLDGLLLLGVVNHGDRGEGEQEQGEQEHPTRVKLTQPS